MTINQLNQIQSTDAKEILRFSLEASPCTMILIDGLDKIVFANSQTQTLFGYATDELTGQPFKMLVPEYFCARHSRDYLNGLASSTIPPTETDHEIYGQHKDGRAIPIKISSSLMTTEEGAFQLISIVDLTEHKRCEDALFQLASILESSNDAIIQETPEGMITGWNKGAERIYGYTAEEVIGHPVTMLMPPEQHNRFRDILARIRQGEHLKDYESVRTRKDGQRIDLSITVSPVRNARGEVVAIVVIARNITERKQTGKLIRESEENFQALVKATTQAVWSEGENARSKSFNDWWLNLTGQNLAELEGWQWLDALHPDDREDAKTAWSYALEHKTLFDVEYRVRNRNGENRYFAVRGVPVFNQDGSFRQWFGTFTDISERKIAEENLRKSEKRYRLLFEDNPSLMIIYDFDTLQFLDVNEATCLHYGYTREEFLSLKLTDIGSPDDLKAIVNKVTTAPKALTNYGEWQHRKKDGSTIFVETTSHKLNIEGENSRIVLINDVTERKKAEEDLRESEGIFRLFVENVPAAAAMFDRNMNYLAVSQRWMQDFNLQGNIIGRSHYEIFPEIPEFWRQIHQRCLAGAVEKCDEDRFVRQDGSVNWLKWEVRPWLNAAGAIGGLIFFSEDITERKKAEDLTAQLLVQVKSQSQRLNNIIDNVPGNVWEIWFEPDASAQHVDFTSDYIETMTGYSTQEWLAEPNFWLKIIHPEDKQRIKRILARGRSHGTGGTFEFRWIARDGRIVWVEAHTVIITNDEGKPIGLRGVAMDITERKRAEQEHKKSEERYREVVENAHDMIYVRDLEGNYISINQASERITGYPREELLKMNFLQMVAPEYLEQARRMSARKLAGEEAKAYDLEMVAKDGRRIAVEVNTRVMFQDGIAVGIQGIARDVTERKHLEAQLRQSQKMEAVGQLAGGIAHDFNNLLTAITGYSELTMRTLQSADPLCQNLEEIKRAGDRAAALTRQLLAFSRKQVLQPKVLNLNTVVADLEKMLRRLIGENIDLKTGLGSELWRIKADPGQIEQVIVNLAVNARDAMIRGGKLTIQTRNVLLEEDYATHQLTIIPGAYVMLTISDTGMGMDATTQARIFEPFFTTKEAGRGTGLGLSTVYGIIEQSGGAIRVYSEIGQGTTFKIYLPRVEEAQMPEQAIKNTETPKGAETILLIEDEELVRNLTRKVLESHNYKVLEAPDGGAALLVSDIHTGSIDLLLTDVIMPGISGPEAAARLKRLRPKMKVLYMSGYMDNTIVQQGVVEDGVNLIRKPFSPGGLLQQVREALDKTA
jgi:two-component system, cell cycle sensor histidine kinase and response regulator CckA